jgi:glycolate oxidase iron-sulfur subunit
MQTSLTETLRATADGRNAEAILRSCMHCGFCNATCPTYQLLGDELDGPRGRIYLIKQVLEGAPATASKRLHLDRSHGCRSSIGSSCWGSYRKRLNARAQRAQRKCWK